tara:strand:+ start:92 stop:1192 length:1101 start_codon:yes stop_codon:yes gene_type:complete
LSFQESTFLKENDELAKIGVSEIEEIDIDDPTIVILHKVPNRYFHNPNSIFEDLKREKKVIKHFFHPKDQWFATELSVLLKLRCTHDKKAASESSELLAGKYSARHSMLNDMLATAKLMQPVFRWLICRDFLDDKALWDTRCGALIKSGKKKGKLCTRSSNCHFHKNNEKLNFTKYYEHITAKRVLCDENPALNEDKAILACMIRIENAHLSHGDLGGCLNHARTASKWRALFFKTFKMKLSISNRLVKTYVKKKPRQKVHFQFERMMEDSVTISQRVNTYKDKLKSITKNLWQKVETPAKRRRIDFNLGKKEWCPNCALRDCDEKTYKKRLHALKQYEDKINKKEVELIDREKSVCEREMKLIGM